jgi:hypothetical protein
MTQKKIYLLALLCFGFCFPSLKAQLTSYYSFSQFAGSYTPITGGTVLASGSANCDDGVFPVTIPSFNFNGTLYTSMKVSTNGFLAFGSTSPSATDYSPISGTTGYSGAVSGLGADMIGSTLPGTSPEIREEVIGNEIIVQWTDVAKFGQDGYERISFQIRLNTTNSQIKIVYGGPITPGNSGAFHQVGLRGPNNNFATNVSNRAVGTSTAGWVNSTNGTANSSGCYFYSGYANAVPASGTTFQWSAPTLDMAMISFDAPTAASSSCRGAATPVSVTIKNNSGSAINFSTNPVTVNCVVGGAVSQTLTTTLNTGTLGIAATQSVVLSSTFDMHAYGTYTFTPSLTLTGDVSSSNNAISTYTRISTTPYVAASNDVSICQGSSTALTATANGYTNLFNTTDIAIPDNNTAGVNSTISVSGTTAMASSILSVTIDSITHQGASDLRLELRAPNGSFIVLSNMNGGIGGQNYYGTVFSPTATNSITTGAAPFTGSYLPQNPFSGLSGSANGTWTLNVSDRATLLTGTLQRWTIRIATPAGIVSYTWTPSTGLSASNVANPTASPTVTTTYVVTATDGSGCSWNDNVVVTVNPLPVVNLGPDITQCGGTATLNAGNPGATYLWSNAATTQSITASTSGTYSVTVTNANGCSASDAIQVTINTIPTVSISGNTTICSGNSTTLTASGASTYSWSNGGNTAAQNLSPASTTTYSVTGTAANGCTNTASATVTVNTTPTVSITGNSTICNGGSTTLTANGADTYSWSNGGNTAAQTLNPSSTTSYTVTGTASNGCTNTTSVTVTVNPNPTVSVSGNTTICDGSSTTLTASGATSYAWSTGGNMAAETVSPTVNTTYTVTGTDGNSCTASTTVMVTVNPNPTLAISGNTTICNGSSTTITASGANTYAWSNGDNTASTTVSPTTSTTYSVTGTGANGCTSSTTVFVTVDQLPNITISGNTTICNGNSTTLTAGGASSYAWSSGGNMAAETVSPAATTTYTVTGTANTGCTNTATATVTVNQNPVITISGNTTICDGNSTTLSANGANMYAWSTGGNGVSITVAPNATASYSVTGTDNNGCSGTASTTVTVNQGPAIGVSGNTTICNGSSTTITASGANTYSWSSGGNTASETVSPTTTTTYSVTGTGSNGCATTVPVTVTVNALPSLSVSGNTTVCAGNSTTLTASGAAMYNWSSGGNSAAETLTPNSTTTYTVTGTSAANCSNSVTVTVNVNALPAVTANATSSAICEGASVTLTGGGASTYAWTGNVTDAVAFTPAGTDSYTVTGTDANGCQSTASVTITVNAAPAVNLGQDIAQCNGPVTLNAQNAGNTYLWSDGSNSQMISVSNSGTYWVDVTNAGGCTTRDSIQVTITSNPVVTLGNDIIQCGGAITLNAGNPGATYLWSDNSTAQTLNVNASGTYFVTATYTGGCEASDTISVTIFTPPVVTLSLPLDSVCFDGGPIGLSGATPAGGTWSGNGVTATQFDPMIAGFGYQTITYTFTDANGCTSSNTDSMKVVDCTGIWMDSNNDDISVNVFPNPSSGVFTLNLDRVTSDEVVVTVFDLTGQVVYSEKLNSVSNGLVATIDLSGFANGAYFLEVNSGATKQVVKVMKEE